jgi:hypothetical protein
VVEIRIDRIGMVTQQISQSPFILVGHGRAVESRQQGFYFFA